MIITPVVCVCLVIMAIERDINYGLPGRACQREFGIINGLYVLLRILAPIVLCSGICGFMRELLLGGIGLYILAFTIKHLAWRFNYGIIILPFNNHKDGC